MLDIKLFRESPEILRESQKKRGFPVEDVDRVVGLDKRWRELKEDVDSLRAKRNKISQEISEAKKHGKKVDDLLEEARKIPQWLAEKEQEMNRVKDERDAFLREIPNIIDKSVPVGDATKNKILKVFRKPKKLKFEPRDHADILEKLNLLDTRKAGDVAGSRFYYLKGDLVRLNFALLNFALDFLSKNGFTLMQPPFMLRRAALEGALPFGAFGEAIYKIDGEDLHLIGTAEHAINAYLMNETIEPKKLPLRFAGFSSCFRKEAGSHGKDTKGIFRVHQFEKIEQFVFCRPEDAWKEFDLILKNSEQLLKQLGIPFRFVVLSTQETGRVPTKTIDFEGWFPSQNAYRELGSCSNCLDYQSRRSGIKYQDGDEFKFVYTLNNTAIATERMMACIVDNFQQKDGTIKVPKVLQKWIGKKVIGEVKKK